jgi:aminomethyltransferase
VLVVCNAGNHDKIAAHFARETQGRCSYRDASDATSLLALQGPKAVDVLRAAGAEACTTLAPFHIGEGKVGGASCLVARTGYTGEDGFEIFCANGDALGVFRTLLDVGKPFGIEPVGLGARDTLRLEAKLPLYGNDIDETTDPFEAVLGWTVKLDANDFLGRDALRAKKKAGLTRKLVGFEMTGRGIARHGYPIVIDGKHAGIVTSGSPSPTLGNNIGLGYVPIANAEIGSTIGIEIRDKVIDAKVVPTPFYRRKK